MARPLPRTCSPAGIGTIQLDGFFEIASLQATMRLSVTDKVVVFFRVVVMNPKHYQRRVLVCVTGLSPQVVTETVYALAHQAEPWIPTEVHVLTTVIGAQRARLLLLAPDRNQFRKLVQDHSIEGIRFDDAHIHVLEDAQGRPLEDIRTQADNMAMADAILHRVAHFAMDDDCAIHVSLAGGRKSMGFFAGYALSLCGRPQDRLSHVLVSPELESHPEFFFPPREPRVLISHSQEPVSTADAVVELADIPFVRLRDRAPRALIEDGRFIEVVEAAQRMSAPPCLKLSVAKRAIECAGETIVLPPMRFAVYAWHASRTLERAEPAVVLSDFDAVRSPLRRELYQFGSRLFGNELSSEYEEWNARRWDNDADEHGQWLSEQRNRINKDIGWALGDEGRRIYGIQTIRLTGRRSAHGLGLPAACIEFDWA